MCSKLLSAGDIVEAHCTRCRTLTNHTIVAMVGGRPVRVRCNTCGGDHNFRAPQKQVAKPAAVTKPVRKTAKSRKNADQEQWQGMIDQTDPGVAVPYSMDRSFKQDEIVAHPVFGLGVVTALIKPNKVEILFTGGKKMLRCQL